MLIYTNKGLVRDVLTCWLFDVIWSSKGQYQGIFGGGCVKCRLETMQWGCFFNPDIFPELDVAVSHKFWTIGILEYLFLPVFSFFMAFLAERSSSSWTDESMSIVIGLFRFGLQGYWCTGNLFCCVCVCLCLPITVYILFPPKQASLPFSWLSVQLGPLESACLADESSELLWFGYTSNIRIHPTNHDLSTWVDFPPFC